VFKKKGTKLQCSKCNKKYLIHIFYKGNIYERICKNCIICTDCGKNFWNSQYSYTGDYFEKTNILLCCGCIDKKRACEKCGGHNDTTSWMNYSLCQKCLRCEKCGKSSYKPNSYTYGRCDQIIDNYKKTGKGVCC
jgi:hypothetical protein